MRDFTEVQEMVQDMKLFAKTHKNALLVNAVMVCICYLHMAFSQNVGIDTERIIVAEGPLLDSWKTVGRQGLLLSKMIGMPGRSEERRVGKECRL